MNVYALCMFGYKLTISTYFRRLEIFNRELTVDKLINWFLVLMTIFF